MNISSPKLKKGFIDKIAGIVGINGYSLKPVDRIAYARDSNFRDNISVHYNEYPRLPSMIIWPTCTEQLGAIIRTAGHFKVALLPVGGGSGLCSGASPLNNQVVISTTKLNQVFHIDPDRLVVDAATGIIGLDLENQLNRRGFTLGHFPASFSCATLGGYLATRAAGQLSNKYGKIEDLVIDLEFVDGHGHVWQTTDANRTRGFDLTQLLLGSEGTLGIITKARLKIFPQPAVRKFVSFSFHSMSNGIEAQRRIIQTGIRPDILRLYDKLDAAIVFSRFSSTGLPFTRLSVAVPPHLRKVLQFCKSEAINIMCRFHRQMRGLSEFSGMGCVLIGMIEGDEALVNQKQKIVSGICSDLNARDRGEELAAHWYKHRYSVPFKIPRLFLDGAFADTIETATTWDNLLRLYQGVLKRLRGQCLVLTHISHLYPDGAAIYFSFVSPLRGKERGTKAYDHIWQTALTAIQDYDGVLSHHNGIGRLKTSHIKREWGEAIELFRNLKDFFDPHGILNPEILGGTCSN